MTDDLARVLAEVRRCAICAVHLPLGPRPLVQVGRGARIVVIGQAPGTRAHESGVPWNDDSGERLREWTGLDKPAFYDPERVALMPMGFCYPGAANGADLPPRPECAPLWHARLLALMTQRRLTLLVGIHAQRAYLGADRRTMTQKVRAFAEAPDAGFPLPHPSWRSTGWMRKNPWFETELLPELKSRVAKALR